MLRTSALLLVVAMPVTLAACGGSDPEPAATAPATTATASTAAGPQLGPAFGSMDDLRTWVNGEPLDADPTRLVLDEHQEIVIAVGTAAQMPKDVPSTYDWEAVGL